jgi:NACHT domain
MALRDTETAFVLYFCFDFRDKNKQSRQDLLHSLLTQLSAHSDHCYDLLFDLYLKHDRGSRRPSDGAMVECLKEMLLTVSYNPTYIIIDALDECPHNSGITSPREHVLNLLKELVELGLRNFHICATSRPELDIQSTLESLTQDRVCLHNEDGQKEDIVKYVHSVVYSDKAMRRWKEEDKTLVIQTLSEKADGM